MNENSDKDRLITNSSTSYEHYAHITIDYILQSRNNLAKFEKKCVYQLNETAIAAAECLKRKGKILICGNGGSASDALHIAAELVGRFKMERHGLPCIALNANVSSITAIGNDYGYENVFSRQLEAFASPGDMFIGISTSGNSKNVINAFYQAKHLGLKTVGLCGNDGGAMKQQGLCDILLAVPSDETSRIQEMHILAGHIICKLIEVILFSGDNNQNE